MALRNVNRDFLLPMPIWDRATRLFHWLLVLTVAIAYAGAWIHQPGLHRASGFCVLALLLFRIAWGFVGSDTARFAQFMKSPAAAWRQLADLSIRAPDRSVGHNAACGWMTVIILAALAGTVGTGLARAAGQVTPHARMAWILLGIIALHLAAILAYAAFKRQNLVRPMFTGRKRLPGATPAPRMMNQALALVLLLIAGAVSWAISLWF
jgi:cytochrome b